MFDDVGLKKKKRKKKTTEDDRLINQWMGWLIPLLFCLSVIHHFCVLAADYYQVGKRAAREREKESLKK